MNTNLNNTLMHKGIASIKLENKDKLIELRDYYINHGFNAEIKENELTVRFKNK